MSLLAPTAPPRLDGRRDRGLSRAGAPLHRARDGAPPGRLAAPGLHSAGGLAPFGELGFLLPELPEEYGGAGANLAYQLVVLDELTRAEVPANTAVHSIATHYILDYGTEAQKQRWLPRLTSGELLAGIALTEPGCGSDLKALRTKASREGDHYVIDGAKTFITNGFTANLLVVAVRTGDAGSAASLWW
jgi:alkylation response protein AidB-like acyl-CoA dehydrogenase